MVVNYIDGIFTHYDKVEAICLPQYTVDGKEWSGCIVSGIQNLTHPIFKCPIRTVKNRNTAYLSQYVPSDGQQVNEVVNAVYCPTNSIGADRNYETDVVTYYFDDKGPVIGSNGEYELDPDNNQCIDTNELIRLPVFGPCKNNCKGWKL